jgi:hypothetical protein
MFSALAGSTGKGGEDLEYVWDDGVKMKAVFAEPQRIDASLDRVWKYVLFRSKHLSNKIFFWAVFLTTTPQIHFLGHVGVLESLSRV